MGYEAKKVWPATNVAARHTLGNAWHMCDDKICAIKLKASHNYWEPNNPPKKLWLPLPCEITSYGHHRNIPEKNSFKTNCDSRKKYFGRKNVNSPLINCSEFVFFFQKRSTRIEESEATESKTSISTKKYMNVQRSTVRTTTVKGVTRQKVKYLMTFLCSSTR